MRKHTTGHAKSLAVALAAFAFAFAAAPATLAFADEAEVAEQPVAAVSEAPATAVIEAPEAEAEGDAAAEPAAPAATDDAVVEQPATDAATEGIVSEGAEPVLADEFKATGTTGAIDEAPTLTAEEAVEFGFTAPEEPVVEEEASEPDAFQAAADPVLADGEYVIRNVQAERLAVSGYADSTNDGTSAVLEEYTRGDTQIWVLEEQSDGTYTIGNAETGYVLTVAALEPTAGTTVVMFHQNGNILQRWNIIEEGAAYRILSAADANIALEIASLPSQDVDVRIGKVSSSKNQLFYFVERYPYVAPGSAVIEEGAYLIEPTHTSGSAIQIRDVSYDVGAVAELYSKNGDYEQKFFFDYDDEGYYVIANVHSGLVLDVKAADVLPRATVWQYEYNGTDAQKWVVRDNGDGTYTLINKATATTLNINQGRTDNGAPVQAYLDRGASSQRFNLERVSIVSEGIAAIHAELNDGLVFDVPACSRDANKQLWIYEYNGTTAQKIYFHEHALDEVTADLPVSGLKLTTNGSALVQGGSATVWATTMKPYDWRYGIEFTDTSSGKAIECKDRGYSNGTLLQVATPNGDRGQLFLVERVRFVDDGLYTIYSAAGSDKVLDLYDWHSGSGGNIDIWTNYDVGSQQFYIIHSSNGWYKIVNAQTGLAIEAENSNYENGVNVEQTEWYFAADRQLWSPEIAPDGYIYFINKATGMALDAASAIDADGTNVRMYKFNGSTAQKWYIRDTYFVQQFDPAPVLDDVQQRALDRANSGWSSTDYYICVDLSECRVLVFWDDGTQWTLDQDFICSPGAPGTETVTGDFTVQSKGYSFGSGYTCYYYTQFYGNYLFHSVLYYQGTRTIMDGRLGQHLSHGCVRMDIDNAYWIYSTIPYGTRVSIYW